MSIKGLLMRFLGDFCARNAGKHTSLMNKLYTWLASSDIEDLALTAPGIPKWLEDIVTIHEFRYTLPDEYKPHFDYYVREVGNFPQFLGESCSHPDAEYEM
jgi:hypothetical protein